MNNKLDFLKIYNDDLINTKNSIDEYIRYLYSSDTRVTNAICGSWGSGKSYFINQLKSIIDENNKGSITNYGDILRIDKIEKKARAFVFNASEYDFYDEPFTAFLFWFMGECGKDIKVLEEFKFSNILSFVTKIVGYEVDLKKLKSGQISLIKEALDLEKVKNQIHVLFKELVAETSDRIVIFVDELDRCEPHFAVKLIERLKHFVIDDRFVFVYSVDIENLESIVKGFYGETYNAGNYFEKIIDFKYFLNKKNHSLDFFISKKFNIEKKLLNDGLKILMNDFGVTIRELNKILPTIENIRIAEMDSDNEKIFKILIVPLLKIIKIKNPIVYQNIVNKKNLKILNDNITEEYNRHCINYVLKLYPKPGIATSRIWFSELIHNKLVSNELDKVYNYYINEMEQI